MNKYKILICKILVYGFLLIAFVGCSKKESDFEKDIIAHIGDHKISVKDFQLNYEFGFANLKIKGNKKLSYLEFMIDEALLSQEGYHLGLDLNEKVKNKEKELLNELLVEELFKKEVDEKINISEDEIKDAISKSRVKWKLRYWVEPNLKVAEQVYNSIKKNGYKNVIQKLLNTKEVKGNLEEYETNYLTWLDIPFLLLNKIKNLQINKISKPIKIDDVFILVEVTEIKQNILSDYDYQIISDRYKQILFYREQKKQSGIFIKKFMNPKEVITKGKGFGYLSNALREWKNSDKTLRMNFKEAIDSADNTQPELLLLKNHLEDILVTFKGGSWSIKDYLGHFNTTKIIAKASAKRKVNIQLNHQIAITLRNHFFIEEALSQELDKSVNVKNELKLWRDKWVYDELRKQYTDSIKVNKTVALEYFNANKYRYKTKNGNEPIFDEFVEQAKRHSYFNQTFKILNEKLILLKKDFRVRINKELLDSVKVLDSKKSRWATISLLKGNNGRMAIPTVDPYWSLKSTEHLNN